MFTETAVLAITAVGMMMVIITSGIDLSIGSIMALGAMVGGTILKNLSLIHISLTGFERTKKTLESDTYKTAVFGDGVLDITFSGDGKLSSLTVEKVERTANSKPAWLSLIHILNVL